MSASALLRLDPSLSEAEEIRAFWEKHHDELVRDYPEMFVAVKDDEVVASNADLALLVYALRDLGFDARHDVAIEFITAKARSLLL